jgi:antirestriction protein ArdC
MAKKKFDIAEIHAEITEGLIAMMEQGIAPWSRPWIVRGINDAMAPKNGISNRRYNGFNSVYLSFLMEENQWNDPRFYTMNSLPEDAKVRKGSKSTIVIYSKKTERDVEDESTGEVETQTSWFQRYYRVFNGSQIDGIEPFVKPEPNTEEYEHEDEGYPEADLIATEWCDTLADFHHGGDRAFYLPSMDSITMPNLDQFPTLAAYYQTLFHEIAHSTGHESRGNRLEKGGFGTDTYAKEELVAEFAAAFLCANTEVPLNEEQSAAYLKGWAKKCKAEPKMLYSAANAAQYAANMVMENTYAMVA